MFPELQKKEIEPTRITYVSTLVDMLLDEK
jgi:hypothetical protein